MSQIFLVLSDNAPPHAAPEGFEPPASRGRKHQREDDTMSVESADTKRPDVSTSAEKNRAMSKNKPSKSSKSRNK